MTKNTYDPKANENAPAARRALLGTGAMAAAGIVLGGIMSACGDDDTTVATAGTGGKGGSGGGGKGGTSGKGTSGKGGSGGSEDDAGATDADVEPLNGLLTAEYQAIAAYSAGADLINKAKDSDPLFALRTVIVDVAVAFQSQHKLHAEALVDAINGLKGTPVTEAKAAAGFAAPAGLTANPTITNVLKFAASAERGAAVAYNQVLAGLEDAKLRMLASAIEGDESQHFIVLAALVLGLAGPTDKLSADTAGDVVPEAFATTVGSRTGLDKGPPLYFP